MHYGIEILFWITLVVMKLLCKCINRMSLLYQKVLVLF